MFKSNSINNFLLLFFANTLSFFLICGCNSTRESQNLDSSQKESNSNEQKLNQQIISNSKKYKNNKNTTSQEKMNCFASDLNCFNQDKNNQNGAKLAYINYRVHPSELKNLQKFYLNCGMETEDSFTTSSLLGEPTRTAYDTKKFFFPKSPDSAQINFIEDASITQKYAPNSNDLYWKIGFGVHDVDSAKEIVEPKNHISLRDGHQFLDVGYLTYMADPSNFCVELLQTTFEENKLLRDKFQKEIKSGLNESEFESSKIKNLGMGKNHDPVIGQLTLRSSEIEPTLKFYKEVMGMKLLCVEKVKQYNFDLYFLAFTEEEPPCANVHDVVNRYIFFEVLSLSTFTFLSTNVNTRALSTV